MSSWWWSNGCWCKWSPQILLPGTFNHRTQRTVQMIICRIWTKKKPPNQNLNCSRLSSSLSTNVYWDRCRCLLRYMIICNATDWRNSKYCRTFSGPSFCDPNESENIAPSCVCLALKNAVWKILPHDMYCRKRHVAFCTVFIISIYKTCSTVYYNWTRLWNEVSDKPKYNTIIV